MQYVRLGNTGLEVSRICLGCMSYGDPERGSHPWVLGKTRRARSSAGRWISVSTSSTRRTCTPIGASEEIVGRALRDFAKRDEVVIATKVHGRMRPGPNGAGLSRKHILNEIDNSLRRLGTDYVDLYQIHRFDPNTPVEETMEALHDVVKAGKARYIGASSMYAWQFLKLQHAAEMHGWTKFVSMQNHYNLFYREEEREMMPLCQAEGSALSRGARWRAAA